MLTDNVMPVHAYLENIGIIQRYLLSLSKVPHEVFKQQFVLVNSLAIPI